VNKSNFLIATALLLVLSFVTVALAQTSGDLTTPNMPGKMKEAIQKSLDNEAFAAKTREVIKPDAEPGFLGIPGAPQTNLLIGLLWAIWVGWIFSTVGAFGGIMAGVGHITSSAWPTTPRRSEKETRSTTFSPTRSGCPTSGWWV